MLKIHSLVRDVNNPVSLRHYNAILLKLHHRVISEIFPVFKCIKMK